MEVAKSDQIGNSSGDQQLTSAPFERPKGVAPIKKEFLVVAKSHIINWDHLPDDQVKPAQEKSDPPCDEVQEQKRDRVDDRDLHPSKKFKLKGQNKSKLRYKIGKKNCWSRNKSRFDGIEDAQEAGVDQPKGERERINKGARLCLRFMEKDGKCQYESSCDYCHDLHKIYKLNETEYFDDSKPCFIYSSYGRCQYGTACLFAKSHVKELDNLNQVYNLIDHHKWSLEAGKYNFLNKSSNKLETDLQIKLRKKKYDWDKVTKALNILYKADVDPNSKTENSTAIGAVLVDEFVGSRDYERKKVNFRDKLCLAPLTTVGNLPFRRLCKKFSCDITCAEMSLCMPLLQGNPTEWSHLRRHESEDIFGIQLTGNHCEFTTKAVKMLCDQCDFDFIDFNCGCPTEWIYQTGAGAGLMNRPSQLRKIIAGAAMVSTVPITVKMRAGASEDKNTAHNLINSVVKTFSSRYIGAITVHGRSRAQRYTKLADWQYVNECARFSGDIPLIGSGDCVSWQEYYDNLERYKNISGVMIARGALLSPWLFTEIKERRTWDISSKKRLEVISDYVKFALDHWGSDATGVENCRRYLLEWLSFACRYIPVGLLEVLPQKINDRPPMYKGRDELETLLSSQAASDWVKISEMFLGRVPDNFKFLPKHKANAYESVVEGS